MALNQNSRSRRDFLVSVIAAIALMGVAGCGRGGRSDVRAIPWGLQLYTLGDQLDYSFRQNLTKLGEMGYRKVELAGLHGQTPREWRAALRHAGLEATSIHVPSFSFAGEKSLETNLDELIEQSNALGVKYMVVPLYHIPQRLRGMRAGKDFGAYLARAGSSMITDDWKANAEFLNKCGEAIAAASMALAYHNPEFAPVGDTTGMDILLSNTDPNLVYFELDAAWTAAAGYDVIEVMSRYPGRFKLLHVKDIKPTIEPNTVLKADITEVGAGTLPWSEIIPAARIAGVTELFVEQDDNFQDSRMDSVAASLGYLRSLKMHTE